jgi:hypothetical protein
MKHLNYLFITLIGCFLLSCDAKDNLAEPQYGFKKIIGTQAFDQEVFAWDLVETEDNGYLTLSTANTTALKQIHLFKTTSAGEFEFEIADSSDFKNALPKIIVSNGKYYLFAMHQITLQAHLLEIDLVNKKLIDKQSYADFLYPTAIEKVDDGYLLQGFDRDNQRIRSMKLSADFAEQWRERYSVFEDPIQFNDHLLQTRPLPFFCGLSANYYFMGSMYNYTLNLLFINKSDGKLHKRITGFRYDAGVSNLFHISGNDFFLTKYNIEGETSVLPKFTINQSSATTINSQNVDEIPEKIDLELPLRTRSVLKPIEVNGQKLIVYLSNTKSQEVLANFYDYQGNLVYSKRLGGDIPYYFGNVISGSDGSLIFLCKTYIGGRIPRLVLVKLNPEEVNKL